MSNFVGTKCNVEQITVKIILNEPKLGWPSFGFICYIINMNFDRILPSNVEHAQLFITNNDIYVN